MHQFLLMSFKNSWELENILLMPFWVIIQRMREILQDCWSNMRKSLKIWKLRWHKTCFISSGWMEINSMELGPVHVAGGVSYYLCYVKVDHKYYIVILMSCALFSVWTGLQEYKKCVTTQHQAILIKIRLILRPLVASHSACTGHREDLKIICYLWRLFYNARVIWSDFALNSSVCERACGFSWQRASMLLSVCISECKADCETCFTRNFCTKCKSGFYLYSGKCLEKCPDGLEANNHTMECTSISKSGPCA